MHGLGMGSGLKRVSSERTDWLEYEGSAVRGFRRYRAYLTERSSYLLNPFANRQQEDSRAT